MWLTILKCEVFEKALIKAKVKIIEEETAAHWKINCIIADEAFK